MAEGTSPTAAKAFARYYVRAINYAAITGDTQPASSVSRDSCESCSAILDKISGIYGAGGHLKGEGWKVRNIKYQPFQPDDRPILSVGILISPQTLVEEAGASPRDFPGGRNQLDMHLVHKRAGWLVVDFERAS